MNKGSIPTLKTIYARLRRRTNSSFGERVIRGFKCFFLLCSFWLGFPPIMKTEVVNTGLILSTIQHDLQFHDPYTRK